MPMLETRTHGLLSRLQGNAPRLVSLGLAALIAVEAARILISLLGATPVKSPQAVPQNTASPVQHTQLDVQTVVSAHLFGVAATNPGSQDAANAPQSTSNLVLAGTVATQDPRRGVAIISDGGLSKVYSVGDNIGGASLHSVYLDRVILDRAGALETLLLPRLLGPGMRAAPIARRPGGDVRTVAAVDNIRRMVQQDPGLLDQVMRVVPSYDSAAGKLRGFRAYPGKNRQIFNKLGLKSGDLVTAINGTALDDPQHSQEVFNTIQTSDHATVTLERGGQRQEITLNIAQVAAQATKELEGEQNSPAGVPANGAAPAGGAAPAQGAVPTSSTENPNQ